MVKILKHVIPFILTIVFLAIYPIPALAAANSESDFTYTVDSNYAIIHGYKGEGGAVIIPDTLGGYPVKAIGEAAFSESANVTSITIPAGVTSISSKAFLLCMALQSFAVDFSNTAYSSLNGILYNKDQTTLVSYPNDAGTTFTTPDSVTSIGDCAFYLNTELTSVSMPNVINIGDSAFLDCSALASVSMPNVANICEYALAGCSELTSITIPASATSIGDYAFMCDSKLTAAYFRGNAPVMDANVFNVCSGTFKIYYQSGKTGFTDSWNIYTTVKVDGLTVTYDGNANTGGSVPTDTQSYFSSENVTVLGNTGSLVKTGYTFAGWNTATDGSGTSYSAGATLVLGSANVTLYAQWTQNSSQSTSTPIPGTLQFSAATFSAYEGSNLGVTVTRRGGSDGAVGVSWALTGGTAGVDFTGSAAGTLSFADGEYSKTITLAIIKDSVAEPNAALVFTLSNPTGGATLGTQKTASVKINDYITDTKKLKNTVKTLTAVNKSIELKPGAFTEGQLLVSLNNNVSYNAPPSDATWKSSNEKVATVANGIITAAGFGSATITATYGSRNATFSVKIASKALNITDSNNYAVSSDTSVIMLLGQNEKFTLKATDFEGKVVDVTDAALWTSSNAKVAAVAKGVVTTSSLGGQAVITEAYGGKTVHFKITTALKSLTASVGTAELKLKPGETQKIRVTATFADGSTASVEDQAKWNSSSLSIAVVDKGVITAGRTDGKATIAITYGGKSISIKINTTITLSVVKKSIGLAVGGTSNAVLTATYSDGTTADVTSSAVWKSSNEKIATVKGGLITAIDAGKATITASYKGKSISIIVDSSISKIEASQTSISESVGETTDIVITATNADGTTADVTSGATWNTSKTSVATVSGGKITGVSKGTAIIMATYKGKWVDIAVEIK